MYGTNSESNEAGEEEDVEVAEEEAASGSQCQWGDCTEDFPDQAQLVTHINSQHVQNKRGSEEYPCYWRVSISATLQYSFITVYYRTVPVTPSRSMRSTSW